MTKNVLLFFCVFVVALEFGLRITGHYNTFSENSTGDFWFEWAHQRDSSVYAFPPGRNFDMDIGDTSFHYVINELGYREKPMPKDSPAKSLRVFVVGDSFAEGNGTEYHRSWTRNIESMVKTTYPDAEFYVCGISGLDPHFAWLTIKDVLFDYSPTHILTTVNDSDFDDQLIRGGFSRFQTDGTVKYRPAPWFLPAYRISHILRMVVHELFDYDYYLIRRNNENSQRKMVADSIAQCLVDINKLCLEKDVKFMTVIHPIPHSICFESEMKKSAVLALSSYTFDFPVVKMYSPLKAAMIGPECTTYHWKQDSHFNGKGYKLFADVLFNEIEIHYKGFWEPPSATKRDVSQSSGQH